MIIWNCNFDIAMHKLPYKWFYLPVGVSWHYHMNNPKRTDHHQWLQFLCLLYAFLRFAATKTRKYFYLELKATPWSIFYVMLYLRGAYLCEYGWCGFKTALYSHTFLILNDFLDPAIIHCIVKEFNKSKV